MFWCQIILLTTRYNLKTLNHCFFTVYNTEESHLSDKNIVVELEVVYHFLWCNGQLLSKKKKREIIGQKIRSKYRLKELKIVFLRILLIKTTADTQTKRYHPSPSPHLKPRVGKNSSCGWKVYYKKGQPHRRLEPLNEKIKYSSQCSWICWFLILTEILVCCVRL